MSEEMTGQVEAYTQGYDKGFEQGRKIGYLSGLNFAIEKLTGVAIEIKEEALNV